MKHCTVLILLFVSILTQAEPAKNSHSKRIQAQIQCDDILSSRLSHQLFLPEFDYDFTTRHKFGRAFRFSSDGKFVSVGHESRYPEQLGVYSLETGENLASVNLNIEENKGPGSGFSIDSSDFDADTKQIAAIVADRFPESPGMIINWEEGQKTPMNKFKFSPGKPGDFFPAKRQLQKGTTAEGTITHVSLKHPFYLRTSLRQEIENPNYDPYSLVLSVQLIDWKSKKSLNLPSASERTIHVTRDPFSSEFRYVAILQNDQKTIQIVPFDDIFAMMADNYSRTAPELTPEFRKDLIHKEPVTRALLSKRSPLIVTQTKSALHIWNAKTGEKLNELPGPVTDCRLLDKMGLLAYTDDGDNLLLYSLYENRFIEIFFDKFNRFHLESHLENYLPGVALITLKNGQTLRLTETVLADSSHATYQIQKTGVRSRIDRDRMHHTEITTEKGKYIVKVYSGRQANFRSKILLNVYSLDGSGKKVLTLEYPVTTFFPQFAIDPTGQKIVYTADDVRTGILRLKPLLVEHGL